MPWETKKSMWLTLLWYSALLQWSGIEPAVSPRYACTDYFVECLLCARHCAKNLTYIALFPFPSSLGGKHYYLLFANEEAGDLKSCDLPRITQIGRLRQDLNPGLSNCFSPCVLHCGRNHSDLLCSRTLFALYTWHSTAHFEESCVIPSLWL